MDGRARLLTERISRVPIEERVALAVMWGCLLVLALPGLVLTFLKDPENLPIALTVTIGGNIATATFSVLKLRVPVYPDEAETAGIEQHQDGEESGSDHERSSQRQPSKRSPKQ